jgi:quercetin dioxygenase-like cupin family protein
MPDIATKKVFENDKISVWEMVLEPGESTGVHTHSHDYVFYVIEGSTAKVTDHDGKLIDTFELGAGEVMSFRLEGDELVGADLRIPATHDACNIGSSRYREILVESK